MRITLGHLVKVSGSPGYSPFLYVELQDEEGNWKGFYEVVGIRQGVAPDLINPAAVLIAKEPDLTGEAKEKIELLRQLSQPQVQEEASKGRIAEWIECIRALFP